MRSSKNTAESLRNVLKRFERVRHMIAQGNWEEGRSVFGLPKIKQVKLKTRKAVKEEKEETATTETSAAAPPSDSS